MTTAVESITMVCVKWINFTLFETNKNTYIGHISVLDWNEWPESNDELINPFIWTIELQPSRYALSYIPQGAGDIYVEVAFIALDSENLDDNNADSFYHDFGDNMFPYYKGNSDIALIQQESVEDDGDEINTVNNLSQYLPESVLRFLTTPIV